MVIFHSYVKLPEGSISDLVGGWGFNPSGKYESQLGWLFPIFPNIWTKNVPNHQPATYHNMTSLSAVMFSLKYWLEAISEVKPHTPKVSAHVSRPHLCSEVCCAGDGTSPHCLNRRCNQHGLNKRGCWYSVKLFIATMETLTRHCFGYLPGKMQPLY